MHRNAKHTAPVLVVGYDGSRASHDAFAYAVSRAGDQGTVVVSHTFGPGSGWFGAPSYHSPSSDYEARGRACVAELDAPPGVRVEIDLNEGVPAEQLVRVAAERDADEIVIGSRGFFPLHSGPGSVSQALLRTADRPVVVIPVRAVSRPGAHPVSEIEEHLVDARS